MGRRPDLSAELLDAAREVAKKTKDFRELRQAMSVLLSGVTGMTLPCLGEFIGRSRASVARFQSEFRAWFCGRQDKERKWGGRRRAYVTFEQEKEFLSVFLKMLQEVGFWWSARYALRWKRSSGARWSKLPYTGCWQDMVGGK